MIGVRGTCDGTEEQNSNGKQLGRRKRAASLGNQGTIEKASCGRIKLKS